MASSAAAFTALNPGAPASLPTSALTSASRASMARSRCIHHPHASFHSGRLNNSGRRVTAASASAASKAAPASSSSSSCSSPPAVGDEVEVECTSLAFGGRGVCKIPGTGFVLLCERAVPGERLIARVTALKKGGRFAEAVKTSVLMPSPNAVEPPCPHFQRCGGCAWQDVSYPGQLVFKREQVLDVMTRIAKVDDADAVVRDIVPSLATARYRNKMEFAFSSSGSSGTSGVAAATVGLRPQGNHSAVVEVLPEGCMLQHTAADGILERCVAHLRDVPGAAGAMPAFDRRTGSGVLRSITIRTAPVRSESGDGDGGGDGSGGGGGGGQDDGVGILAMVDIAAAVDGGAKATEVARARTKAALAALAADLAAVPGVHSVVHTAVASEPELRLAAGRRQGWVKGGRGGRGGGGGRGGRGKRGGGNIRAGGGGDAPEDGNDPTGSGGGGGGGRGTTVLHGSPTLPITLRGVSFELSSPSFFQTNTAQAERLVAAVEAACGFRGDKSEVVLDLFCGVGTLGLCVASQAKHVYGWEVVPEVGPATRRYESRYTRRLESSRPHLIG